MYVRITLEENNKKIFVGEGMKALEEVDKKLK